MNIVIACSHGKNRSVYLKHYLQSKGYNVEAVGVKEWNAETETILRGADKIISVHPIVARTIKEHICPQKENFIELNVEDRPQHHPAFGHMLDGDAWYAFQETHVYPELKRQIEPHLPLKDNDKR